MANKGKIALVNSNKEWGGGELWFYTIARNFHNEALDYVLLAHKKGALLSRASSSQLNLEGVSISNLTFLNLIGLCKIFRLLKKHNIQQIIVNSPSDLKVISALSTVYKFKTIIYRRGSAKDIKNSFLNRCIFKHVIDKVIVNSIDTKKSILKNNKNLISESKIKLLYNGVKRSSLKLNRKLKIGPDSVIRIGNIGRLSPEKQQSELIKIGGFLRDMNLNFTIEIAGEGAEEDSLQSLITQENLNGKVKLVGFQKDVKEFLARIDVYVHTSSYEGFGFVLIEAMSQGVPVISYNFGAAAEIIHSGYNGFVANMPEEVAQLIRNTTEEEWKIIQTNAFRSINENFILDDKLAELKTILDDDK